MRRFVLALVAVGLCSTSTRRAAADPPRGQPLKASVAKVDVTPMTNGFPRMFLAGYTGRDNIPAGGVVADNPITARALAFREGRDASTTKVIVTLDLVGMPPGLRGQILDGVWRRYRLKADNLLLSTSHTHSGPVLTGSLDPHVTYYGLSPDGIQGSPDLDLIDSYTTWLRGTVIALVGDAIRQLDSAPSVELSYGVGQASFGENRIDLDDVDPAVPVLAVRRTNGTLLAVVFGYACHAIDFSYTYNADFPGVARTLLEADTHATMAFFIQGAAGDINPAEGLDYRGQGAALAAAVEGVLTGGAMRPIDGRITTELKDRGLPLELDAADTGHVALRALYDEARTWFGAHGYAIFANHANQVIDQIDRDALPTAEPWAAHAWRFGERAQRSFVLAALGGEVVSGYSIELKDRFEDRLGDRLWIAAYANVVPGYIPTTEVWDLPFHLGMGPGFKYAYEAGHPVFDGVCPYSFCAPTTSMWGTSQMYYGWAAPLRRGDIDQGGTVPGVEQLVLGTTTRVIRKALHDGHGHDHDDDHDDDDDDDDDHGHGHGH